MSKVRVQPKGSLWPYDLLGDSTRKGSKPEPSGSRSAPLVFGVFAPSDNEVAVRLLLLLVMSLGVLLTGHEYLARSSAELRLTLHGVKIVSEDNVATVHELTPVVMIENFADATVHQPPPLLSAVEPVSDATVNDPPAPVTRVAIVPDRKVTTVRKPPEVVVPENTERTAAILLPRTIAATVLEQKLVTVLEPTALAAPIDAVSDATMSEPPAPAARVTKVSQNSAAIAPELMSPSTEGIAKVREPSPIVERIAKVVGEKDATAFLPSAGVVKIAEVSRQNVATVSETLAPSSECEQIWEPTTHMSKEEWSEACRRVDAENNLGVR